jgi:hypothetical protein
VVDDTGRLIRLARKYYCPAVERSCEGLLNEHLCQDPKNAVNVFQVAAAIGFVSICKSVVRSFDIERSWTENEKLYAGGDAYKVGHKKGALAVLAHWSFADLSQTLPEYIWALCRSVLWRARGLCELRSFTGSYSNAKVGADPLQSSLLIADHFT